MGMATNYSLVDRYGTLITVSGDFSHANYGQW